MPTEPNLRPTVFVIFGIGGDLAWRKLIPALYNLFLDHWLPENFQILGLGHKSLDDEAFIEHLRQGLNQQIPCKETDEQQWPTFASHLRFQSADFDDPLVYTQLAGQFEALDKAWNDQGGQDLLPGYTTPGHYAYRGTDGPGRLPRERDRTRIVVEKPFGRDLASAEPLSC